MKYGKCCFVKCIILTINVLSINHQQLQLLSNWKEVENRKHWHSSKKLSHCEIRSLPERTEERWFLKISSLRKQSDQGLHCHYFCIFWNHCCVLNHQLTNFRTITVITSSLLIFRVFTVGKFIKFIKFVKISIVSHQKKKKRKDTWLLQLRSNQFTK